MQEDDFERVRPKSVDESIMRLTLAMERIARNTDSISTELQLLNAKLEKGLWVKVAQ